MERLRGFMRMRRSCIPGFLSRGGRGDCCAVSRSIPPDDDHRPPIKRNGTPPLSSEMTLLRATILLLLLLFTGPSPQRASAEIYLVRLADVPVVSYSASARELWAAGRRPDVTSAEAQSYVSLLRGRQDTILAETLQTGSYTKLYSFHYLVNGFAVQMTPKQAATLAATAGVVQVEEDRKVQKMTTHSPEFLGLPNGAWPMVGGVESAGEGVVIGVIDTGIDPTHPSFSASGGSPYAAIATFSGTCEEAPEFPKGSCNGKIIGARHFAAAAIAAGDFNASRDSASPFDSDGHGSHTAATAAGNNGVKVTAGGYDYGSASGMAPRARLAIYKALYPFGGYIADVVAAVDQAVQDGVDILSLSLGPTSPPAGVSTFLNVFDVELLFAVKAGVFVAQAGGNSGPAQSTMLSFSPWITSVAAGTIDRTFSNELRLGNAENITGVGLAPPTPGGFIRMVSAQDALRGNGSTYTVEECQQAGPFNQDMVKGSILLCMYSFSFEFGTASIERVADTALQLGAVGFVLVCDPTLGTAARAEPTPILIPGIVVTDANDSVKILKYYNDSTVRDATGAVRTFGASVALADGRVAAYGSAAPVVATFSSRGPDILNSQSQYADVMKPDIMAPGYLIWSAWSPKGLDENNFIGEDFAMLSGTSMATPHIAGVAALIKQVHPSWTPSAVASALLSTANLYDNRGNPIRAQNPTSNFSTVVGAATPFDFGAGAVNPTSAIDPGLVFEADFDDYIRFLCVVPGVDPASVREATGVACAVSPSNWASDLNKPYITIANLVGSRTVTRTLTGVAGAAETYEVSVDREPSGVSVVVTPLIFTARLGETVPLFITAKATASLFNSFSFGSIAVRGNRGHFVHIPLTISPHSTI